MATPRKFQEKIALLQQKEAEGKMEYDQIMNEVHELTKGVCVKAIAIPRGVIIRSWNWGKQSLDGTKTVSKLFLIRWKCLKSCIIPL